jgi:nickel-dependent lactate racemase
LVVNLYHWEIFSGGALRFHRELDMAGKRYRVPYSKSFIEFELPGGMHADMAVSQVMPWLEDVPRAIRDALDHPIGSPPLGELAKPGSKVCIVYTDVTRSSPDHLLVPAILSELEKAGVRDADITLLCGIGMHRKSTPAEKIAKLGVKVVERYRVVDSEPQNPAALVDLGVTQAGVPVQVHRLAVEADLLIATGIVEPHQYAGYSGGR